MKNSRNRFLRNALLPLALGGLLSGCGVMDVKKDAVSKTQAARKGPESAPQRSITNFSAALGCMDRMLMDYGVRDVSVLVEDITDQTKKVNAGTKDMLISAVSDMTKRSRAVKLIAFGSDSGNLVSFLQQAERKQIYEVIPQYDIKGSITQWDENVIQKQKELGVGYESNSAGLNIGIAKEAASSILGLDLTILSTSDLSVVHGVTSRNSVVIFKEGSGYDGDARIKKFGINFSMNLSKSEGQSQALRGLVELASIELFGKLTKTPYWSCLGSAPNNETVREEITDWFDAMYANPAELVAYFQKQLHQRGYYAGPADGQPNPQLRDAVSKYRVALGLSDEPRLDFEFFDAYLKANHSDVLAKNPPPASKEEEPVAAGEDLTMDVAATNKTGKFSAGEVISLTVKPSRDAHVYCYMQDETRKIMRFYPNRFSKSALVHSAVPLNLPDNKHFEIVANAKRAKETVACFATEQDISSGLSPTAVGTDFEYLPVSSLAEVRDLFVIASDGKFGEGYFHVETK